MSADRVGIGWRPELAAGILTHRSRIDVVEVIADDLFDAPKQRLRAMQLLAAQVPVVLHGVSLGLASTAPVDERRLGKLARVVNALKPGVWSEHLAFVRGGGVELGHLAAPPRTLELAEGLARNLARAREVVGVAPLLENVATLIDPPGSALDEGAWVSACMRASGGGLLLDLNNLYSNAVNFGLEPLELLLRFPLHAVSGVHLAGGKWIQASTGERRLLDDHRHDVSEAVYALLREVGARCPSGLTVVLERDGAYPAFEVLLAQLDRAREVLAEGRANPVTTVPSPAETRTAPAFGIDELARLYVEPARLARDPRRSSIDATGLELAAQSFARKRAHAHRH